MTVEPTKLNPRRLRSLLKVSDSGDVVGISFIAFQRFDLGRPSTNRQQYASKVPNSSWIARNARALRTAATIFNRFRMMAGSDRSFRIRASVYRATFAGSKSLKARR